MGPNKSALLLFLGDPAMDRRVQSFERLFRESGWHVELIAPTLSFKRGPRKFAEHHRKLLHAIHGKRTDVVLACDLYSLSAARVMRQRGHAAKLIYDSREVYVELPAVAKRPLRRAIWKGIESRGLQHTDRIIVTAPHDLQAILDVHGFVPQSTLIRNLPWKKERIDERSEALRTLGIPEHAKTIVYLGGLQVGRALPALVEAIKELNAHLLLIGDGALRSTLEQIVAQEGLTQRVHFSGAMSSDAALDLAAACDAGLVLVEPISKSYELALPSKLFEYMMLGLPIVTNRMQHVVEILGEQPWLSYVEVNNMESIVAGISHALTIDGDARNAERDLALKQFHFEAEATPLLQLLSDRY